MFLALRVLQARSKEREVCWVAFLFPGLCMLWTVLANSPAGVFYPKYGARGLIKPDAPSVQKLFVGARKKKKKK